MTSRPEDSITAAMRERITQSCFAGLVGISQQAVSAAVTDGALPRDGTAHEWLLAYCLRLREQAAGRAGNGDLDLVQERAELARAQRVQIELKTAIVRGEYAPIGLLEDVLGIASSAVADRIEGLEGLLRKVAPDLPEPARDAVLQAIAGARNEWVRATERLVIERLDADLDEHDADPAPEPR